MVDRNPLQAAPFSIGSHPYCEKNEPLRILLPQPNYLPLDVLAAVTFGRHVHFAPGGWGRRGLS